METASGPRWLGIPAQSLGGTLIGRGSRGWYIGGCVGLVWLVNSGFDILGRVADAPSRVAVVAVLVGYAAFFLVIPPINWRLPARLRLLLPTALWASSFLLFPWLGWGVYAVWAYVGVCAAMSLLRFPVILAYLAGLALLTVLFAWGEGLRGDDLFYGPAIITSVSLMMAAFAQTIISMNRLRATQHEMARLAVEQERSRVARDLHDILGHSLTVITVKAELAGRLISSDPDASAREISEIEGLARGALADVRSTVGGYRGVSIASELANARTALGAAGIEARLPGSVDVVPAEYRELFGWAVREGVTNVVRHSQATRCEIELGAASVEITDNGRGPGGSEPGTGLDGLRERVAAAGMRMTAGAGPDGGFRLRVSA